MIRENQLIIILCHCCTTDIDVKARPFPKAPNPLLMLHLNCQIQKNFKSWPQITLFPDTGVEHMCLLVSSCYFFCPVGNLIWFWLQNQECDILRYPNTKYHTHTHKYTEKRLNNPDDSRLISGIVITNQNIKFFKEEKKQGPK